MDARPTASQEVGAAELTVDQLAARVGLTVRNVRAYAARGLLPPPRMRGRTGFYGPDHIGRLLLVREMLSEGFTLTQIEQSLAGAQVDAGAAVLALRAALMAPWLPEPPEIVDVGTLTARSGHPFAPDALAELQTMGVIEELQDGRLRLLDPALIAAGLQVMRLGIAPAAVVSAQRLVAELVDQAAQVYVQMFRDTAWREFADAGLPQDEWPRMQQVMESIQPVAAQALLASFRAAMARHIAASLAEEIATVGS